MPITDPLLALVVDLAGTAVFAVSGGLLGVRRGLDVFGVVVLAMATGLGGGLLRDVLIGAAPPAALQDWRLLGVAVASGLVAFSLHGPLERLEQPVLVFDALGLGLFCVAGSAKALAYDIVPVAAVAMGVLTAIGGGVARDVLVGRVPVVLRREIYATAALLGAAIVVLSDQIGVYGPAAALVAAGAASGYRLLAVLRGWNAPRALG